MMDTKVLRNLSWTLSGVLFLLIACLFFYLEYGGRIFLRNIDVYIISQKLHFVELLNEINEKEKLRIDKALILRQSPHISIIMIRI
jgi:hypothetical protein